MDQMMVFPSPTITKVISIRGAPRVHARGLPRRDRFTVKLSIAGDGTKLPPFVVWKTTSRGKCLTVRQDPVTGIWYTYQYAAWTNVTTLHHYANTVLKKHFQGREGIFIFDHNPTHSNVTVLEKLADWHIHYTFVPPTATAFVQPLDVSVNRVFRGHYDALYNAFVMKLLEEGGSPGS
jgi:hypothetical protein